MEITQPVGYALFKCRFREYNWSMKLIRLLTIFLASLCMINSYAQPKKDAKKEAPAATAKTGTPLDVNSATAEELQKLPGIGAAYSKKIIDNRPYNGKDDIVAKAGVPQATYDKIKDMIIAKKAAAKKK